MYHQLTPEKRSQIFALLQKKTKKKDIALIVGYSKSTLSREIRRNSTEKGNYLWDKAHGKAMERRKRTTANRRKDPAIIWEALDLLRREDWSPEQISADMKKTWQGHIPRAHIPSHPRRRDRGARIPLPPQDEIQPPRTPRPHDQGKEHP